MVRVAARKSAGPKILKNIYIFEFSIYLGPP